MITGGDLRQSRLDVGYKTFTISPCLVGAVFEPIAKLSLSLTCFLLFIDALVLSLAMLLFHSKKAKS